MKIKYILYLTIFLLIQNGISAESFFENQKQRRIQKPFSLNLGLTSISNYYSVPFLNLSYTFNANHEFGFAFINSKFKLHENPIFFPVSQGIFQFNETYHFKQNSGKIFYNYYLFDSAFFLNSTLGFLPTVETESRLVSTYPTSTPTSNSQAVSYTSIINRNSSTFYFSPGLGIKLSLENGVFLTISGGPIFLFANKTDKTTYTISTTSTDYNVSSNILFNLPVYKNLIKNESKSIEAYIDFGIGTSL